MCAHTLVIWFISHVVVPNPLLKEQRGEILQSLIARGGGRKPVSLISPTAQRVAVIGHNRAIIPPLIRHTSQPASSRLNMV